MLTIITDVFKAFYSIFKIPFYFIFIVFCMFSFMCVLFYLKTYLSGRRLKKGFAKKIKRHGFFRKLLIDAPKQYVEDLFNRNPDEFAYKGLIIYEGRQGSGKTSTMIHDCMQMQEEFPLCKVITNLAYLHENDVLNHWYKLTNYKNGIYGVIAVLDELQNWFSSNQSKNFPPEMLQTITQNRKNRRILLGTAQSFNLLAKAIRTQCTEVRKCSTFLGCITFVRRFEPYLDSQGDVKEWKKRGYYFYVHDKKLRDSYDTYKVIESLVKSGFKDEQSDTNINNFISIPKNKK